MARYILLEKEKSLTHRHILPRLWWDIFLDSKDIHESRNSLHLLFIPFKKEINQNQSLELLSAPSLKAKEF